MKLHVKLKVKLRDRVAPRTSKIKISIHERAHTGTLFYLRVLAHTGTLFDRICVYPEFLPRYAYFICFFDSRVLPGVLARALMNYTLSRLITPYWH